LLGSRKCNIIHTRLRHQCSSLGVDVFRANIVSDPSCACGCSLEGIDLQFGSNEFHERIVDGKNDLENVSKRHLGTLYCKEFLRYNC
jgi:hypothetical protein